MQIYLVGGAVRDALLGLNVHDRDWVVTGANVSEMLALGYQQVGRDFPVFLHPESKEEYALARTERKAGRGYHGFVCDFSRTTTLEEDLQRRDLTINAIAQDENGRLIDPFGGVEDLEKRLLRHVSPAFKEDPLRVLRLLRFHAQLAHLGFEIAAETWDLAQAMVRSGELNDLTPERCWLESEKAMRSASPALYFQGLQALEALDVLGLQGQTLHDSRLSASLESAQRWAILLEDTDLSLFLKKMPVPKQHQYWIKLVQHHAAALRHWVHLDAMGRWRIMQAAGSLKQRGDVLEFAHIMGLDELIPELKRKNEALLQLKAADLMQQGFSGSALGEALQGAQLQILASA